MIERVYSSIKSASVTTRCLIIFLLCFPLSLSAQRNTAKKSKIDLIDFGQIARYIVEKSAKVQEGELVVIKCGETELGLAQKIAVAIGSIGGHPMIQYYSDEMLRNWYKQVPEKYDTFRDEWLWKLNEVADVVINFQSNDPAVFNNIDEKRLNAWDEVNFGNMESLKKRGARVVNIGNDLFPIESRAKILGVKVPYWEQEFWKGVLTDSYLLSQKGSHLKNILQNASIIRITHPNGTDINLRLTNSKIVVTDGTTILDANNKDEMNITWLPGGEVTMGIDPERTEGRMILDRFFFDGEEIKGLELNFSQGRLLTINSQSKNHNRLYNILQISLPLSAKATGLKFGTNPNLKDPRLKPLMGEGMISLSMGSNVLLGGDIDLPFLVFYSLSGSTVYVDDEIVIKSGMLVINNSEN
jgi:leucyl aminopeptidase (aminopeptidase T)